MNQKRGNGGAGLTAANFLGCPEAPFSNRVGNVLGQDRDQVEHGEGIRSGGASAARSGSP
ncbi:hypothetical protein GS3922_02360 [Geobacillus subterraneus]|uniref:Uncharacterized protein n=2 Tax=Geobacillus TaxID=129337 RepID=A0ABM6A8S9_9BACL|nr:hypothetical protein GS3922_02360 [Geobacillus subterraneus]KZS26311.1 hypothetical protein A5418_15770 [Geobacillus subterraneus]OXB90698.1 hypothetical protein B9L21_02165 [Geobacillus uzenensis]